MTEHTTGSTFGSTATDESTTDQVKDQVRDKAQVAQDKAKGALGQARGQLRDQVDQRSTQAGERVATTAADVRSIAEELRQQGKDTPARMVDQVAGQVERFGDYLKGASGDRILRDVEGFARSKPWLVAAGGLALGFAASRVLKASSSSRYQSFHRDHLAVSSDEEAYGGPVTTGVAASTVEPTYTTYTRSAYATEQADPEPAYPATTNELFDDTHSAEPVADRSRPTP
jgi:hypothetical protein